MVPTDVTAEFKQVDAWTRLIWLYGEGRSGTDLGFRYRKQGDTPRGLPFPATRSKYRAARSKPASPASNPKRLTNWSPIRARTSPR